MNAPSAGAGANSRVRSLRARLFVMIVLPLVVVAVAASAMRYVQARDMSTELYDQTLKVVAHAVAREVVLTQGDVLADALLDSLVGAIGDPVYYQVSAAGGRFIAGYSDAPVDPLPADLPGGEPVFFDASYLGDPVRVVIQREFIADPVFDGWTTVQVWQTVRQRERLSLMLLFQAGAMLAAVVLAAALLVWFGINRGLAPLAGLRDAVALRSADELTPIRRPVPPEVAPLVATINQLFHRLRGELERRDAFIGNAAHQLRNPVAAIHAQAQAALESVDPGVRAARLADLTEAARRLSRMTRQLLNLDIATHAPLRVETIDLGELVAGVARRHVPRALDAGVDVMLDAPPGPVQVQGNRVLLAEAVDNLIDNALSYGSPRGSELRLQLATVQGEARIDVHDAGPGIPAAAAEHAFERFVRLGADDGGGSGLGLAIVRAIAESHGGRAELVPVAQGCAVRVCLPLSAGRATLNNAAAAAQADTRNRAA